MTSTIYELKCDITHRSPDLLYDAKVVPFPQWQDTMMLSTIKKYSLPTIVQFDAFFFHLIGNLDYPDNNLSWPIMSKRMLNVLLEVGDFLHETIPIMMVNCETKISVDQKIERSGEQNHDFVAVQLLEHQDFFDKENSIYKPHPRLANRIKSIDQLVVHLPDQVPPLFRLAAYPTALFVSSQAKEAMESAQIKGVKFVTLAEFSS